MSLIYMPRFQSVSVGLVLLPALLVFSAVFFSEAQAAEDWRGKPIPHSDDQGSALTYHNVPVDLSASKSKQPLVTIAGYGVAGESFYARQDKLNGPYFRRLEGSSPQLRCRSGVAERLQAANRSLANYGVELFVLDGYRSVKCQDALWKFFLSQAPKDSSEAERVKFAGKYCSDPTRFNLSDSHTWPSHATGGAVDLTLRRKGGELLYMGGVFDDPSEVSTTDYFENGEKPGLSAEEARRNRRLLYWAMLSAGFTNYHSEWWHYDYGDQMWIQSSGSKDKAFYGPK